MKKSRSTLERQPIGSFVSHWDLCTQSALNISLREIKKGGREEWQYHKEAYQFIYILQGEAFLRMEGRHYPLFADEGMEIQPGFSHQISNRGRTALQYLLINAPSNKKPLSAHKKNICLPFS